LTEYLTEQEQLQQLVNWIKQYGPSLFIGILIAIFATSGWHYWQRHLNNNLMQASDTYTTMLSQDDRNEIIKQANVLLDQYPKTPYAQMASLMLARDAIEQNHLTDANTRLEWAMTHGKDATLRSIARLRLARLLIAEQKPTDALKLLDPLEDNSFNGLADEIRGDAAVALHQTDVAKKNYAKALTEISHNDDTQPLLQLKYNEL